MLLGGECEKEKRKKPLGKSGNKSEGLTLSTLKTAVPARELNVML